MDFDVFFALSQTPVDGYMPTEAEMFRNFLHEVRVADELGYGVAWIAESHLSSEVQKRHANPVIPHWKGEVGLNVDFLQLASLVFKNTHRIECGSAIMNILCNGGPVAAAERVAAFLALHGLDPAEQRRLHVGFAAGRFDFMNRAYGLVPRNDLERAAGRALKGRMFAEAGEIFVRLLRGDTLASDDVTPPVLRREHFRSNEDWVRVQEAAGSGAEEIPLDRRFVFDVLKIIPADFRRELLQLVIGSHEPAMQEHVNQYLPVHVFNLSITRQDVIEDTHRRMRKAFHGSGGRWLREYMPRTTFVFVNDDPGLTPDSQRAAAHNAARKALGAYWTALQGTLDPAKVERAADNALIGNTDDIVRQIQQRFHADDRLMLWFDFFNHDPGRVAGDMATFARSVMPRLSETASF